MSDSTRKRISGLDGIRGIAFLMVFVSHMGWRHSATGGQGVAIFFFLSGFLITTLLRSEATSTGTISIRNFYIRRFFRICPPLYVTVLLALALYVLGLDPDIKASAVLSSLLYYSNFYMVSHGAMGGLGVTWSLSVEEHYYLIFPLMFLLLCRRSRKTQALALALTCTAVLAWRCYLGYVVHANPSRIYMFTDTRFDLILLGSLLAVVANPLYDPLPRWFLASPKLFATLGAAGALLVDHIPVVKVAISYTLLGLCLFPVYWFVITYKDNYVTRFLDSRVLGLLGAWSYSMYLIHQVIIGSLEVGGHLSEWKAALIAFPLCLAYGALMERFIEEPSHRLRNRVINNWGRAWNKVSLKLTSRPSETLESLVPATPSTATGLETD